MNKMGVDFTNVKIVSLIFISNGILEWTPKAALMKCNISQKEYLEVFKDVALPHISQWPSACGQNWGMGAGSQELTLRSISIFGKDPADCSGLWLLLALAYSSFYQWLNWLRTCLFLNPIMKQSLEAIVGVRDAQIRIQKAPKRL